MKNIKKILNLVLVMVLALAMNVNVSAADNYTITIKNDASGHTYEAYQIFSGDLFGEKLSNIKWGTGVSEEGQRILGDAAAKVETLKNTEDAEAFAKEVSKYLTDVKKESVAKDGYYEITGLTAGYYLIKDQDGSISGDDTYTSYILKVVGDVEATPKGDKPEVEKKVDDKNDSEVTEDGKDWQDSADYDIGDEVPFKLTGTLPTNYADYQTYKYVFHDTMSAGLTYNYNAKVYAVNTDGSKVEITEYFKIAVAGDEGTATTMSISCDDLKVIEGINSTTKIVVEYTATLNEDANIGAAGNPNEVYLEYSNNPNHDGNGEPETGETPKDKVIVFTFKTIINKVDENGDALAGAEFTLEKYNKVNDSWETVDVVVNDEGTTFTFTGLDDGFYRLTETKTPDGYNSIDPIYFIVTAKHDITSDNPELTDLEVILVDEKGNPIDADLEDGGFVIDLGEGTITTDIENKSGAQLPSTGGMGTTIFYVVGGSMMFVAAVLLITKRKLANESK